MSELKEIIGESIERIFASAVDRNLLDTAERGDRMAADALWRTVADSGFTHILSTVEGDPLAPWVDAYPVFHALGRYRVPLPLAETAIANALLDHAALTPCDGPLTLLQVRAGGAVQATIEAGRLVLSGAAAAVPWARGARAIVIAAVVDGESLLGMMECPAPGLRIEPGHNLAREARDTVYFERSPCRAFASVPAGAPDRLVDVCGALARAATIAGAVDSVLQECVGYAGERIQFGRPIAKFQAIQQALAVLAGEAVGAQSAAVAGFEAARPLPTTFGAAVAKIRAGQAAGIAAGIAHQVHGAIGFTREHSLHYATRRLWSWRAEFGAESAWAQMLGEEAITRGSRNFWGDLIARQTIA